MQNVVIIYKANTPEARALAENLAAWLEAGGVESGLFTAGGQHPRRDSSPELALPRDAGLVVVLGGDGTMLGAAREVIQNGLGEVPILGVNLGGLGFLTALSPEETLPAMEKVLAGEFQAPPRLMLQARVERNGREWARVDALNDIVINKAALARILELEVSVDGRHLTTFRSDGLIIATPTGSTAYNLSAGGPICHPELDCVLVTPICSFALSNRPLLVSPHSRLAVDVGHQAQDSTLTCDGQVGLELTPDDLVYIERSPHVVRLIPSPFRDYFEILRTKLRWG